MANADHDGGRGGAFEPRPPVRLRPVRREDEELLYRVYASTRAEELAAVDWSDEQKDAFLHMQFAAQHRYYQENYLDSTFDVVMVDGEPAGRLYVARWREELRIIDIALLPAFRGRGIGSALIEGLGREAAGKGLPLRIHVERGNPALALYERLGFRVAADRGVYLFLERP
jgi:ribosomal protein S18 acetylase RimI-like enzyme